MSLPCIAAACYSYHQQIARDVVLHSSRLTELAGAVGGKQFGGMPELVDFVLWVDAQLAPLSDERQVLKMCAWPEARWVRCAWPEARWVQGWPVGKCRVDISCYWG